MPGSLVVVGLLLLAGCGDQDADLVAAQERWAGSRPSAYAYTYRAGASSLFTADVEVRGADVQVQVIEGDATVGSDDDLRIEAVFEDVATALREADDVEVEYDERFGYPRLLQVDQDEASVDDEYGIRVEGFVVLPQR